ncbi:2-polyprenyl-3-methyl-5-hydroxy-6-metoxy-1,4-benzoquinol methylase [Actinoplanes lutulentus]|uniref:Methyltransferase family protein n=1 Tax=Actinoplanes lutulentus TaxID=1287878 RepID=A0A327Z8G4_9ACTN|nr:class I SAM-dependent methyltransferase [Actinoplanes lutulentus]MBB2943561.1 2-polyprenyl-3-methyl-5-hydroxy-6-metoxy-1,4-benzoquinol methylase [Actinoplanes lutulentus]RAK27427.1 methyltransferase family protein [Actinoplanes lutulentus]
MSTDNLWLRQIAENPSHSQWYIDRFREMAARGDDLGGEARMIDAMVPRGARILDAGCGTGRVGGRLAASGHDVTGVDLDPELIEEARRNHPGVRWQVGDLSELSLGETFDVVVCAGNVMTFAGPSSRAKILVRFREHLADGGRAVVGFGAGRGYEFDDFLKDSSGAGLRSDLLLSTWDLRPSTPDADFLVAVLRPE